jgi:predicted Zn-dependent protease
MLAEINPLVEKLPPDSTTLTLLGNAYMVDRKPELALQQFEKAAALDPENAMIKTRVAVAEIRTGKGREGLGQLEQVLSGQADPAIAGPTLVLAELRAGRVDKAAEVVASLIRRDGDNPLYQTLLGEVRVAQRDDDGAKAAYSAALTKKSGICGGCPRFGAALHKERKDRRGQEGLFRSSREETDRHDRSSRTSQSRRRDGRKRRTCSTRLARRASLMQPRV